MTYHAIRYEIDDRVAILTFSHPEKLNAFDALLKSEVATALAEFESDDNLRVMIITGAGGRAFSVGFDLRESTKTPRNDVGKWHGRVLEDYRFCRSPWDCSKPIIAMIPGHCLAGGLEFALMCDLRYCSDNSTFGVVETRFSAGVATLGMPWVIGGPRARELIYTGDTISSADALECGLVNRVFPKDKLHLETLKIAKRMSQVALDCLKWNKRAINHTFTTVGLEAALQYGMEACTIMDTIHTPEYLAFAQIRAEKGLKAALDWRDHQFKQYE